MDLHLPRQIVRALEERARQEKARQLRESPNGLETTPPDQSSPGAPPLMPQDDWERLVLGIGSPCGIALSDADLSSDGLYE